MGPERACEATMVRNELKYAEQIKRKETVEPENQTPKREAAAEWIEEHVVRAERYRETTISEMAEESGWSRQHIANTLEHYFEPAPEGEDSLTVGGVDVDLLLQVYREGYRNGLQDAREGNFEEGKTFGEVVEGLQ